MRFPRAGARLLPSSPLRLLAAWLLGLALLWAPPPALAAASTHRRAAREVVAPTPAFQPGESFEIDIGALRGKLAELADDERPEQLADWTVDGTLLHARLGSTALRDALYDKVPFRDPSLEEIATFDYGRGRRVILADGAAWLFYPEQAAHPEAILGRLADQVRMELGTIPPDFSLFSFHTDAMRGSIRVTFRERIPGGQLFSTAYGYVPGRVSSVEELKGWLGRVDDLTHLVLLEDGAVELGGRRFPGARTEGVGVEEVATLYQGQARAVEVQNRINRVNQAVKLFNQLIALANSMGAAVEHSAFSPPVAELDRLLSRLDGKPVSPVMLDVATPQERHAALQRFKDRFAPISARLETELESLRSGKTTNPSPPAFSLDPQWDRPGLVKALKELLDNPAAVVSRAQKLVSDAEPRHYDDSAVPFAVSYAQDVLLASRSGPPSRLAPDQASALRDTLAELEAQRVGDPSEQQPIPFLRLMEKSGDAPFLYSALQLLKAENAFQCARYEGGLQGTRVGMNLFYGDLLAKLWAFTDYHRSEGEAAALPVSIGQSGNALYAVTGSDTPLPGEELSQGARKELLQQMRAGSEQGLFFFEETPVLSTRDWDAVPGETVSSVLKDEQFVVKEVSALAAPALKTPGLREGSRRYLMRWHGPRMHEPGGRHQPMRLNPPHVYLISRAEECDEDSRAGAHAPAATAGGRRPCRQ